MAEIFLETPAGSATLPLSSSTLLGRHFSCAWRIPDPRLPLYWLELRWMGRTWGWRVLSDPGNTRGPLNNLPGGDGWRELREQERVHTPRVSVTLVRGGPPDRFVVDLESGALLVSDALDEVIEERIDGFWPVDAEQRPDFLGPLSDGQVFLSCGRLLRFSAGEAVVTTMRGQLSLERLSCELYLDFPDGEEPRLTVMDGPLEVVAQGAYIRATVPYLEARAEDRPRGGWLSIQDAYQRWLHLGGSDQSNPERIAQDRSRLCRALARQGVIGAHNLFEAQRRGSWFTRISLPPERLSLSSP